MQSLRHGQTVEIISPGVARVSGTCAETGLPHHVDVSNDGLARWLTGMTIQVALPKSPAEDREFLMTSLSPEGWRQIFGVGE